MSAQSSVGRDDKVSFELEIGKKWGTSYFVSAVYVPWNQGYVKVDTKPVEKKWDISSRVKIATAKYELPEGSVIVYKIADPDEGVETKAYLVTRDGLEDLEVTTAREIVDVVGDKGVYRFVDIIKAPLGEIRIPSKNLYMAGVGVVTPERLESLKKQAKYLLTKSFHVYFPVFYEPTRKLSDEEFKQILDAGLVYDRTYGRFVLPTADPDLDINKAIAFLKANTYNFTDEDEKKLLKKWERNKRYRELIKTMREIVGVRLDDVCFDDELLRKGKINFEVPWLSEEEFRSLSKRFKYVGERKFEIDLCAQKDISERISKFLDETSLSILTEACAERERMQSEIERVKKAIKEKHGVDPVSVTIEGDHYVVKFPFLGTDKFRELARLYKYSGGVFYIDKTKI